ncbi:glycoside hydrolase family 172 protein [Proteiniphilum sp.]|uniref:glycoside hydrolase family 172 protein n=1 Tax=Proteiniphilum sp. TaxID=1926877 RepID=UPI002B21A37C|nr:glycoside hydrolase family 172 protein [Proteiniphilum sp.]MEA4916966.1 glycoside hydrolase family 172 protein [Proteiniphilum sp.]
MKNNSIKLLLSAICIAAVFQVNSQNQTYRWSDELELLKRVDRLPAYRENQLMEQESSYDRTGGNNDGFNGTYSFIRKEKEGLVLAEFEGPGVVNRIWTPTPTNDTLLFYFDGERVPRLKIRFMDLFSGEVEPFIKPVCGNEIGGYYCYIPIPFAKSLKIVFKGEQIMFHQIQYRKLPGMKVESWTGNFSASDRELLAEVSNVWADISPTVDRYALGLSTNIRTEEKSFTIEPGEEVAFFDKKTAGRIVGFEIDGGTAFEGIYKDMILSAKWDNEQIEAIHAPLADFFGYAYGKPAMRSIVMGRQGTSNYCYLPMPFDRSASMKLIYGKREGVQQNAIPVTVKVYYNDNARKGKEEGKFYAVWRREKPEPEQFYTFMETKGKGHYIGTVHQAQGLRPGMTLFFEGDDSTYVDGKMRMHGTGSEDYYNGGWYALLDRWDRGISMPIHGSLDYSLPMARTGGYRFFLSDKISFEKEIYHGMEHGEVANNFPVDYTSVAFFYAEQPLKERMEPIADLREVYFPEKHIYFPQLMEITLDRGIQAILDRGLMLTCFGQGAVRVILTDVPEGKYRVLVNYHEKPNGADFQVWQRQKQLSEWISTRAGKESFKENVYVGDIQLTPQTNSVTFHVRNNGKADQFELNLIILERIY